MSILPRNSKHNFATSLLDLEMVVILSLTAACLGLGVPQTQATELHRGSADQEMAQGKQWLAQGAFAQSAVHWAEAERLYNAEGNIRQQSRALTYLSYALLQEGQIWTAIEKLDDARTLSERIDDRPQKAVILGQMGNAKYALGKKDEALKHLQEALLLARDEKNDSLEAVLLNDLGNALALAAQRIEAIDAFDKSRTLAHQTAQSALALTALINSGMTSLEIGTHDEAYQKFDRAFAEAGTLDDSHAKVFAYLNIGLGYRDLRPVAKAPAPQMTSMSAMPSNNPSPRPPSISSPSPPGTSPIQKARTSFEHAVRVAEHLNDTRAKAYALGYIGSLLEKDRWYEEALKWTREAVFAAQKANAPDALYQWHWQTARLLKATGNMDGAQAAYERAVTVFYPIRKEFFVSDHGRRHSFRDSIAPLFVQYEDLLLRRAAQSQPPEQTQQLLATVRHVVELSRIAELQDYYRDGDACVDDDQTTDAGSNTIPEHTAVIYPIMLPDRLELLMQTAGKLQRIGVPIGAEELTEQAIDFRAGLIDRTREYYQEVGQTLYRSLLEPLRQELTAQSIHTLVFVPDGALRAIPMAALYDGKQYAIEQYAIAITPSMQLTDTRSVDLSKANLLSMGLTEARGEEFPALKNVAAEVRKLTSLYNGKLLLDGDFLVPSVEQEMKNRDISIVHFATHGKLEEEVSKSFLLTYKMEERISLNRLSKLVGVLRHRLVPLELITLSACETAAGDDRAALGLAGIAVKSGARSALATLWQVDDEATSELVLEFYRLIQSESIPKAEALRRAQLKIISKPGYKHPNFWSPFLLISNWR